MQMSLGILKFIDIIISHFDDHHESCNIHIRAHLNEKKYLCYTTTLIDISTRHVHQPAIK